MKSNPHQVQEGDKCSGMVSGPLLTVKGWAGLVPKRLLSCRLRVVKAEQEEMEKPLNGGLHSSSWHGTALTCSDTAGLTEPEPAAAAGPICRGRASLSSSGGFCKRLEGLTAAGSAH